jgi:hypothetical protein
VEYAAETVELSPTLAEAKGTMRIVPTSSVILGFFFAGSDMVVMFEYVAVTIVCVVVVFASVSRVLS